MKDIIRFERFDLMKTPIHVNFDLILCRNVMIYFSKEGQQHIHMNFYRALKDGGYMITGKSEILSGEPAEVFTALDYLTRVYQKPPRPALHTYLILLFAVFQSFLPITELCMSF